MPKWFLHRFTNAQFLFFSSVSVNSFFTPDFPSALAFTLMWFFFFQRKSNGTIRSGSILSVVSFSRSVQLSSMLFSLHHFPMKKKNGTTWTYSRKYFYFMKIQFSQSAFHSCTEIMSGWYNIIAQVCTVYTLHSIVNTRCKRRRRIQLNLFHMKNCSFFSTFVAFLPSLNGITEFGSIRFSSKRNEVLAFDRKDGRIKRKRFFHFIMCILVRDGWWYEYLILFAKSFRLL